MTRVKEKEERVAKTIGSPTTPLASSETVFAGAILSQESN